MNGTRSFLLYFSLPATIASCLSYELFGESEIARRILRDGTEGGVGGGIKGMSRQPGEVIPARTRLCQPPPGKSTAKALYPLLHRPSKTLPFILVFKNVKFCGFTSSSNHVKYYVSIQLNQLQSTNANSIPFAAQARRQGRQELRQRCQAPHLPFRTSPTPFKRRRIVQLANIGQCRLRSCAV